jgi:hypothetical protein
MAGGDSVDDHTAEASTTQLAQLELTLASDEAAVDERRRLKPLRRDWTPHFLLSAKDIDEMRRYRGAENRLGFALTLLLIRFLNSAPGPLEEVPEMIVDFVNSQAGVDPGILSAYGKRRSQTRDDHAMRIR